MSFIVALQSNKTEGKICSSSKENDILSEDIILINS